ncbi:MAG: hypothetical protein NVSMB56_12670 [Pyrinomonadaceae bacterium]
MSANLEKVLNEVKTLTPDELNQLRVKLDEILPPQPKMTEEAFLKHLLAKGIISEIPPPPTEADIAAFRKRKPIEILDGKPISETLIEERR